MVPGDRADTLTERVWNLMGRSRNPRTDADADTDAKGTDEANGAIAQAGVDALLLARFLADPGQGESDR